MDISQYVGPSICTYEQVRSYSLDLCPVCNTKAISGCRCILNNRRCANGHHWRRLDNGVAVMMDDGQGHIDSSFQPYKDLFGNPPLPKLEGPTYRPTQS